MNILEPETVIPDKIVYAAATFWFLILLVFLFARTR